MRIRPSTRKSFERAAMAVLVLCVVALYAAMTPRFMEGFPRPSKELPVARGLVPTFKGDDEEPMMVDKITDHFAQLDYRLDAVAQGQSDVPRLFLANLPSDIENIDTPADRKQLFMAATLPLILRVNEAILADRAALRDIAWRSSQGRALTAHENEWLVELAARYRLAQPDVKELMKRVDVVPPSMALAQAAAESGWGTSRFAREGNAIFGQWTYMADEGILPKDRPANASHFVKSFDTLTESVWSYARSLNTHRAYADFRNERQALRKANKPIDGYHLAGTLTKYSERGDDYIKSIRSLMVVNDMRPFDGARLGASRLR
jgi:Bax protein